MIRKRTIFSRVFRVLNTSPRPAAAVAMAVRRTERWFQQLVGGGDVYRRRREYAALREKHNTDPREAGAGDVSANNPLMHTEGSSWAAYFATQEVRKTIALDLERLHPGDEFYSSPDIQAALLDILTVWSLENPSVGYRQGMHELASLVLSQRASDVAGLGHEWGTRSSPRDPVVDGAPELSASYVEHDAYAMFSAMLGPTRAARAAAPEETTPIRVVAFFEDAPGKGGFDQSEVKGACDRVFAALGAVDPPLKQHLERLGIEPQLFLLRWFRVLFSREFHLDDAMRAWSAFFAANKRDVRDVIEAFAAAMVLFLRAELMAADDFGTCLRRLQKFPPVEDIDALIERAREIAPRSPTPRRARRPAGVADAPRGPRPHRRVAVAGDARRVRGPGTARQWTRDPRRVRRVGRPQNIRAGHLREGEGCRRGGPRTRRRALRESRRRDEEFRREPLFRRFRRFGPFVEPFLAAGGGEAARDRDPERVHVPGRPRRRRVHGGRHQAQRRRRRRGSGAAPRARAGGIGIGWIERNAASADAADAADAGERLRDVSLEDGPSDARDEAAQADALRRAVVEVTRVLESGAARGAVEASLRGVVATLENAAAALRRDAST